MSLADWDKDANLTSGLYAGDYHSAPYCMSVDSNTAFEFAFNLCRAPAVQCMKEGRFEFYFNSWQQVESFAGICFRNQAALGTANALNCFAIAFRKTKAELYIVEAGIRTKLGEFIAGFPEEYWRLCRVDWWEELGQLYCQMWVWHAVTGWSTIGVVGCGRNDWSTSTINRIGVGMADADTDGWTCLWDDCKMFSPASP